MTDAELVEELIGWLWDVTKPLYSPLWWCLRDDLKDEFRATVRRFSEGRIAGQRASAYGLERELTR